MSFIKFFLDNNQKKVSQYLDKTLLKDLKKGERLFIVDLETVSIFSEEGIKKVISEDRYEKTPFLFLIASKARNEAVLWANDNLTYKAKKKIGSWTVYMFEK